MNEKEIIGNIIRQAKELGACDKLIGTEDMKGLCKLLISPQGSEFCIQNKFPNTATLRMCKPFGLESNGVYIDKGEIDIEEPTNVAVIGRTIATINIGGHKRHRIVALRGASIIINASEWAVVRLVTDKSCHIIINSIDNSVVI